MTQARPRVALCCDCGPDVDDRHVLRCLAVAEELLSRDAEVLLLCDADAVPWVRAQVDARRLEAVVPPAEADGYARLLDDRAVDAVVLDSHRLSTDVYAAVRRSGRPTAAVVDGEPRRADADLLVDPGIGAEDARLPTPPGTTVLAGLGYAPMRNDVLANRPISPPRHEPVEVPRVVGLFGDTDGMTAGPAVARVLVETGRAFAATFVSASPQVRERTAAVAVGPRQRIEVREPTWRAHELIARSDVVLASAGPSTAELLCLGAATGLVSADDRYAEDYRRLMVRRTVVGLGSVDNLADDPARGIEKATRLLSDARERGRLAESAWRTVDGLGRARVVDALLALL